MKDSGLAPWEEFVGSRVSFGLLGPLEVRLNGLDRAPSAQKTLQVLAVLLMRPGKLVASETIIDELWGSNPPRRARSTMQTYIYQLRRFIEEHQLSPDGDEILLTRQPGYQLLVAPEQIDVFVFQQLCRQGRALLAQKRHPDAAAAFRTALRLWRGPALSNTSCGSVLSAFAMDLHEQQRNALHLRIQAEIESGTGRDLIGELRSLVATDPMDESVRGQLMRVLSRSGRRVEALDLYHELRIRLNEELGLEPSNELQELHYTLLSDTRVG
ncbi:AfsR/SARP family transcriptional regulator [Saccharopolyspora indica]|uniref:AfsR/SARP family transcriptional regulator n=1 Tax=Saccharopolyspora indica TaxID=1229659 RepID=UPI0022EA3024|nr:AfsR/SARP family transcriptional regulator [Saccharopolyspora indica]MDA3646977.1 AfsR/SARP family transcriptional regulator [Saccharopolyspora indica]